MADDAPLRTLSEQVGALSNRVDHLTATIERRPRPLFEWPAQKTPQTLVGTLEYHERGIRRAAGAYYLTFAVLYAVTALSLLVGTTRATFGFLPDGVRLLAAALQLAISVINIACILHPTYRLQIRAVAPTIGGAVLMLVIQINAAVVHHFPAQIGTAAIFWASMITIHGVFASSIPGRVSQRRFMLQLIDLARTQEAGHHPDTTP